MICIQETRNALSQIKDDINWLRSLPFTAASIVALLLIIGRKSKKNLMNQLFDRKRR